MSKRKPRTTGVEWLGLSMASFNGSGYADKDTPVKYLASYLAYKKWKKEPWALELVRIYPNVAIEYANKLIHANNAGHTPTIKNLAIFSRFYNPEKLELWQ